MTRPRSSFERRARLIALVALVACSCGDDAAEPGPGSGPGTAHTPGDQVGVPQPVPIPIDGDLLRASGSADTGAEVHVIGLPGAVARQAQVTVENLRSKTTAQATSTAVGTFSLFITAATKDVLRVQAVGSEGVAELEVRAAGGTAHIAPPPREIAGTPPVTVEAGGTVVVRGEYFGSTVIGVNLASGVTVTGEVGAQSRFELRLAGASGDALLIYGDGQPLTDPWQLEVP